MSTYDNPNQEVVRADGSGPGVEGGAPATKPAPAGPYDPGDFTVAEVQEYATAHPEAVGSIYEAEAAGKGRSTLLDWLEAEGE